MTPGHPFHDLNNRNARYKILYGGRGSGKTWGVAEALIRRAARYPIRVLCTREYQNSIKDSVHKVLGDQIARLGFSSWFNVTQASIRSRAGAEFMFMGLHGNEQTIKSTEGVDIVWVEEAQTAGESSWRTLIPTIRKEGSEIWGTFNPENETDPTYRRFVLAPPPGAIVHHVNYDQNPYMSQTLEDERLYDYSKILLAETDEEREQAQADYDHIWLGMCRRISNELILANKCVLEGFPDDLWKKAERPLYGTDWGFSQDPTVMTRSFIHDRTLYVEHEAWGIGVELNELGEFFRSVPDSDKWPIKADNARPETISHCRGTFGLNISAADKWKGSVEDGIAFLRGFKKIVIHPRCKHTWQEARSYRYKVDRITKEVLPIIVDKNNHCLAAGTLITTERGKIPIEEVTTNDRVLTRKGFRRVLWAGVSDTNRGVLEITTTHGATLRCTPDHKILTNGVFVRADAVRYNDDLLSESEVVCHEWSQSGTGGSSIDTPAALMTSQEPAPGAAKSLPTISTTQKSAAPSRVLCVNDGTTNEPKVYDITVEDQHEFFANGILVHNCWDSIRYGLDGYITRSGDLGIWQRLGKQ